MIRLYRALLRLFPASFRMEYGEEMTAAFAQGCVGVGPWRRLWLLLRTAFEDVPNALAVHWTIEQAQAELWSLAARLARKYPTTNAETGISFFRMRDYVLPRNRLMLLALSGASLCLLLLTCANLATLLVARAAARDRELGVRAALGAGRERLIGQLITESLVLSLLGGIGVVLVAGLRRSALFQSCASHAAGWERASTRRRALGVAVPCRH
jgi:predicted lysophospholipase L1 biosynthesis ABC-type transport system permease subunit